MDIFEIKTLQDIGTIFAILTAIITLIGGLYTAISRTIDRINKNDLTKEKLKEINESFRNTVEDLSSENISKKIASAILLRRFFDSETELGNNDKPFFNETINVIAGVLRYEKTSEFQKILGDGLAYAKNLSGADLQKTNLQNVYFSRENVNLTKTDFYGADLSKASLKNVDAEEAIFYEARLEGTVFKKAKLIKANFCNSNLIGANFEGATLTGANFKGAVNIPENIKKKLDKNGIYSNEEKNEYEPKGKSIFLSAPNILTTEQQNKFDYVRTKLREKNIRIYNISRDNYQYFGIVSEIKRLIQISDAVVVLGFSDIVIQEGFLKPNTTESKLLQNCSYISPWIHTEIGIAIGSSKPLFILHENGLNNGIFEESCDEVCFKKITFEKNNDIKKVIDALICKLDN
ncbi:MAG: pentapeptide repeat-containing protein [Aliarcobacter cryaerophilus]|nr:pentapeptide repeat-containing protein [Aliarcobacter cryaerophilus]